ncbi:hypothetical protein FACS189454_06950 [Planctomycetales bacterium]|nr:hypothetical protein FACS189454_06950 [Planctomycetales bacterium]
MYHKMMYRITFILFITLCFSVINAQAMTLHVLWITAQNGNDTELGLQKIRAPFADGSDGTSDNSGVKGLIFAGQYTRRNETFHQSSEPIPHKIKHYYFGKSEIGNEDYGCPLDEKAIRRFIRSLQIEPDDAVMIYYRGHGGFDENRQSQFYQFINDNGTRENLYHSDIRLDVETLHPRLAVFIRDCCNNIIPVPTRGQSPEPNEMAQFDETEFKPELFISLFVKARGVIDIGAAKKGMAAYSVQFPSSGGWIEGDGVQPDPPARAIEPWWWYDSNTVFSTAFSRAFAVNIKKPLTWKQFFGTLSSETETLFKRINPSREVREACGKHTPMGYVIDGGIYAVPDFQAKLAKSTIPSAYFGFEGEPVFGGVRLTRVDAGSRAEAYGLEANKEDENGKRFSDIIYAVDDIPVTTNEELDLACRILGDDGKIKFTLINGRDGKVQDFAFPDIRGDIKE